MSNLGFLPRRQHSLREQRFLQLRGTPKLPSRPETRKGDTLSTTQTSRGPPQLLMIMSCQVRDYEPEHAFVKVTV